MNYSSASTIRIARYNHKTSIPNKSFTNTFYILTQLSSDTETTTFSKDSHNYIPPIDQTDWKKGILNGLSWADVVGA